MPFASVTDWEPVKTLAVALGNIREACDRLGVSYQAARQRAVRDNWPVATRPAKALQAAKAAVVDQITRQSGVVTTVTSPSDTLAEVMQSLGKRTKIEHAIAGQKAAVAMRKHSGDEIIELAQARKAMIDGDAKLHGWTEEKTEDRSINFNLLSQVNIAMPPE